jgi:hypothetical protein
MSWFRTRGWHEPELLGHLDPFFSAKFEMLR